MNIKFGPLNENDLEECHRLCCETFGKYAEIEEIRETYRLCSKESGYHFIVGKLDGKIVAYASMHIFYNLFDGKYPVAVIWYVCVDSGCRRMGAGRLLFEEIERIAKENNCEMISLNCMTDNHSAHQFYRALGYTDEKEKAFVKYLI